MPPRPNSNTAPNSRAAIAATSMDVYSTDGLRCYTVPRCAISHRGMANASGVGFGKNGSTSASPSTPAGGAQQSPDTPTNGGSNNSSNGPTACRAHCEAVDKGVYSAKFAADGSVAASREGLGCTLGNKCPNVHVDVPLHTLRSEAVHIHYIWRDEKCVTYEKLTQPMMRDHFKMSREEVANTLLEVYGPNNREPFEMIPAVRVLHTRGARYAFDAAIGAPNRTPSTSRPCHCAHYYFNQICNRGASCAFIHVVSTDERQKEPCMRATNYHRRIAILAGGEPCVASLSTLPPNASTSMSALGGGGSTNNGGSNNGGGSNVSPNTPQTITIGTPQTPQRNGGTANDSNNVTPGHAYRNNNNVGSGNHGGNNGNNNNGSTWDGTSDGNINNNSRQMQQLPSPAATPGSRAAMQQHCDSTIASIIGGADTTPTTRPMMMNGGGGPDGGVNSRTMSPAMRAAMTPQRGGGNGSDAPPPPPPEAFIAVDRTSAMNSPSMQMHSPSVTVGGCGTVLYCNTTTNLQNLQQQQTQQRSYSPSNTATGTGGPTVTVGVTAAPPPYKSSVGAGTATNAPTVTVGGSPSVTPRIVVGGVQMPPTPSANAKLPAPPAPHLANNANNNSNNVFPPPAPPMPYGNNNGTPSSAMMNNNLHINTTTSGNNNNAFTLPADDMDYEMGFANTAAGGATNNNTTSSATNSNASPTTISQQQQQHSPTYQQHGHNQYPPLINTPSASNGVSKSAAANANAAPLMTVTVGGMVHRFPPSTEGCSVTVGGGGNTTNNNGLGSRQQSTSKGAAAAPQQLQPNYLNSTAGAAASAAPCGNSFLTPEEQQRLRGGGAATPSRNLNGVGGSPSIAGHAAAANGGGVSPSMTPKSAKVPAGRYTHQPYTPPSSMHQYGGCGRSPGIAAYTNTGMSPPLAMHQ